MLLALHCTALVAIAAPKDSEAQQLAQEAINTDYLGTDFEAAEKKLKQAIALCKGDGCSPNVKAQMHRDLAVVYIAGMKNTDDGKAQFALALEADPNVELDPDLTTPEVKQAFEEVKGGAAGGAAGEAAEPSPADDDSPITGEEEPAEEAGAKASAGAGASMDIEECPPDFPGCGDDSDKDAEEGDKAPAAKNWVSLGVQQDFLLFSSESKVCSGNNDYACFLDGDEYYITTMRRPQEEPGNEVSGGLAAATLRVLLGYDRLFGSNLMLGARAGFAFGGGPQAPEGAAFVPIHFELRAAYFLGKDPFARAGLRPYLALGGGLAQVDAKLDVAVVEQQGEPGAVRELEAWKKTGTGFAFAGVGTQYALKPTSALFLEGKYLQMFGTSSGGLALKLGYTMGF